MSLSIPPNEEIHSESSLRAMHLRVRVFQEKKKKEKIISHLKFVATVRDFVFREVDRNEIPQSLPQQYNVRAYVPRN